MNKTDYIELTELWHEGQYLQVGDAIRNENWSHSRVADFCAYFAKHIGLSQLPTLAKFL